METAIVRNRCDQYPSAAAAYTLALLGMKINSPPAARIIPLSFRPHCPPRFWYPLHTAAASRSFFESPWCDLHCPLLRHRVEERQYQSRYFPHSPSLPFIYIYIHKYIIYIYLCICGVIMRPQPLLQGPGDSRLLLAENGSKGPSLHRSLLVISTARRSVVGQRNEGGEGFERNGLQTVGKREREWEQRIETEPWMEAFELLVAACFV